MVNAARPGTLVKDENIWISSGGLTICPDAVRYATTCLRYVSVELTCVDTGKSTFGSCQTIIEQSFILSRRPIAHGSVLIHVQYATRDK